MLEGDPQTAFDTIDRIRSMLSLPFCTERAVIKSRKQDAERLIALLRQSIPSAIRQQRARSEVPILAGWVDKFLTPASHKRYPNGAAGLSSSVGKSLLRIQDILGEEYDRESTRPNV